MREKPRVRVSDAGIIFHYFPQWVKPLARGIWGICTCPECYWSGKEAAPSATLASLWRQKHEIDPPNLCDTSASPVGTDRKVPP